MKVSIIGIFLYLILNNSVSAQSDNTFKIGLNICPIGKNSISNTNKSNNITEFKGIRFYSASLNFIYAPCTCSDLETGIELTRHMIVPEPDQSSEISDKRNIDLISLPANIRLNLLKYLLVNGGVLLDFDVSQSNPIDNQTGIGINYGIGVKYDFKFGMTFYANAYAKTHSWISFSSAGNSQKLAEGGVKFGFTYQLK